VNETTTHQCDPNNPLPPGEVHLGTLKAGSVVRVSCGNNSPNPELCEPWWNPSCCADDEEGMVITVDTMEGAGGGLAGAVLYHRGLFGFESSGWETLEIGAMGSGAGVFVGHVSGILRLTEGIAQGASVEVTSVGHDPYNASVMHGIVEVAGVGVVGPLEIAGDIYSPGSVNVTGGLDGSLTVGGNLAGSVGIDSLGGSMTVAGNLAGDVAVQGDQSGTFDIQGNLASGGSVTLEGSLEGSGKINVTGSDAGSITVNGAMKSATMVQARGGLSSGALINVNATGGSSTSGTIWIGGATGQSPMPVLTMDGAVLINCSGGEFDSTAKVKLVGCAPYEDAQADICILGTHNGQITQPLSCANHFSVECSSSCP
jgi:hypothetical protein